VVGALKKKAPFPVLAISVEDAAKASNLGRDSIYKLIREKKLHPRKFGVRTLILVSELEEALNQLPIGGE
jgi:excisionase family DNA binding protein